MQPWFRFYHEVLDDPKVQKLPGDVFKFWVNCLCLAKRNNGKIPDLESVSFAFRQPKNEVEKLMQIMVDAGLIDDKQSGVEPHNWKKRQPKSDSSTERVKQYRKRQCNVSATVTDTLEIQIQNRTDTEKKRQPFQAFWEAFPKKRGKADAQKSWDRQKLDTHIDAILRAIESQKSWPDWRKNEGQFIPYPATWLNKNCWLDEVLTVAPPRMPAQPVPVY